MQILKEIEKELSKYHINKKITLNTKISDLNIDSLDLMQIITKLEEKIGYQIEDDKLMKIKKIGDLVNLLNAKK